MGPLTNADKLARLQKIIKGIYYSDDNDNNNNISTRRLKGGSSSSLSSNSNSDLIAALDKQIMENMKPEEVQNFLEKKEKENRRKLARLSNLIHPLN